MKPKVSLLVVLSILILLLASCKDLNNNTGLEETDINDWYSIDVEKENCPVTAKAPGSFTFVLEGKNYDLDVEETVNFDTEQIGVSLTVTGSSTTKGDGLITIRNEENAILYSKQINGNMINVDPNLELADIPYKVIIKLNDFTGKISFVFAEDTD